MYVYLYFRSLQIVALRVCGCVVFVGSPDARGCGACCLGSYIACFGASSPARGRACVDRVTRPHANVGPRADRDVFNEAPTQGAQRVRRPQLRNTCALRFLRACLRAYAQTRRRRGRRRARRPRRRAVRCAPARVCMRCTAPNVLCVEYIKDGGSLLCYFHCCSCVRVPAGMCWCAGVDLCVLSNLCHKCVYLYLYSYLCRRVRVRVRVRLSAINSVREHGPLACDSGGAAHDEGRHHDPALRVRVPAHRGELCRARARRVCARARAPEDGRFLRCLARALIEGL